MSDHVAKAIERLETAARLASEMYEKPLTVCYSGGKDSQVLVRLAIMSGIDFTARHNLTTVDAPETVKTVKETFKRLNELGIETDLSHPDITMWQLIVKKRMPPTRLKRYCCEYLKERNSYDEFIATGVRKAESNKRKTRDTLDLVAKRKEDREHFSDEVFLANDNSEKRRIVERCAPKGTMCVNPIIDWTDAQVVEFYYSSCEVHNPLYSLGFNRVGCIGCPMGGTKQQQREFAIYPKYRAAYVRAFQKMLDVRRERGLSVRDWESGEDVFHWWIQDGYDKSQLAFEFGDGE